MRTLFRVNFPQAAMVTAIVLAAPRASAELRWSETVIAHASRVGEDTVRVTFAFRNAGEHPVTLVDVKPDCGCTTVALEQKTYLPTERGTLDVFFDARGRSGLQEKTIQVFTDANPKPTTLTARITIPAWVEVSPRLIWWSVGDDPMVKEALVTLNPEADIRIAGVKADSPLFRVSLEPATALRTYRLVVVPTSTTAPVQGIITLQLETMVGHRQQHSVFIHIR